MSVAPTQRPATLRLRIEVLLWRHGRLWLLAAALGLATLVTAAYLVVQSAQLEGKRARVNELRATHAALEQRPSSPPPVGQDEQSLVALTQAVYGRNDVSQVIRDIHAIAKRRKLLLPEAEFRVNDQGFGGLRQQQMTFSVTSTYPQLIQFIGDVLHAFPGVSLDQLHIKRDDVAQPTPKSEVRLSVWVDTAKPNVAPVTTIKKTAP